MRPFYRPFVATLVVCLTLVLSPTSALAGDLQVTCPPGVKIYVGGKYKGTCTAEEEGLFIEGLSSGQHQLKAILRGFAAHSETIQIQSNRLREVVVSFVKEAERVEVLEDREGTQLRRHTGTLVLRSVPPRPKAQVSVNGERKGAGDLKVSGVSSGRVQITWTRRGKRLTHTATLNPGAELLFKADFKKGKVFDETPSDGAQNSPASPSGLTWVKLRGGSFQMGSNEGDDDEKPVHTVTLDGFEMTKSEVTVGQYRACVKAGKCSTSGLEKYGTCNWDKSDRGAHPITCVDWSQAGAFCKWAGGRLPTEAQWEYAARSGGRSWKYPWGDEAATCDRAVTGDGGNGCGKNRTWPVCSKSRGHTAQGLCDMAGNVWEWVADWKGTYSSGSSRNPTGPGSGSLRVNRGGGWHDPTAYLRAANRNGAPPGYRNGALGFRCLR